MANNVLGSVLYFDAIAIAGTQDGGTVAFASDANVDFRALGTRRDSTLANSTSAASGTLLTISSSTGTSIGNVVKARTDVAFQNADTIAVTNIGADNVAEIKGIVWVGDQATNRDIAIDDDLILLDGSGDEIINVRAKAVTYHLSMFFPIPYQTANKSFYISAMDGGVLYIYV